MSAEVSTADALDPETSMRLTEPASGIRHPASEQPDGRPLEPTIWPKWTDRVGRVDKASQIQLLSIW